jgi:hypothetical protein
MTVPHNTYSAYHTRMGTNGLRCSGFAVGAARVATHRPIMLLVGVFRDPSQPAPLSLDTLAVTIARTPAPMHSHGRRRRRSSSSFTGCVFHVGAGCLPSAKPCGRAELHPRCSFATRSRFYAK